MKLIKLISVLIILLLLAGCTRTARSSSPQPTGGRSADAQQVNVELGEWYVKLNPNTVNAGTVQFNIHNAGKGTHAFALEKGDFKRSSEHIDPGKSATMTVDLAAGKYTAYCPIDEHRALGMHAPLTVE